MPAMNQPDSDATFNRLAPTLGPLAESLAPRRVLDRLSELGFRAVQLSAAQPGLRPRELDKSARRDLLATLRRREMSPAGVDLWIPPNHFLDPAAVDRAAEAVVEAIELAADLGRCPLSVALPPIEEGDRESLIGELLNHARHYGVELADHTLPLGQREDVGVGIDPAALLGMGEDPAAAMINCAPRVVAVRLCDLLRTGMRGPIGDPQDGRLDVTEYRAALAVCRLHQPLVADLRQWSDPWSGLIRTASVWREGGMGDETG